jgi:TolA-binding protein
MASVKEAMKKTTLTVLFTFAILVGLAAAPDAQVFSWEPNNHRDSVSSRVERSLAQARRSVERQLERLRRNADRREANLARQIRVRVNAQVRQQMQRDARLDRTLSRNLDRAGRGERYADMQVGNDADPCRTEGNNSGDDYEQHCEVRDSTMPAGALNVDAGQNGGIVVEGWDRNEIRVRAIVRGNARESARARELVGQVQVQAGGGRVYANGPDNLRRENWSVSYRINVPRKNDLDLRASNGGITIVNVTGNMRFDTTNGGVKLQDIGGRVNGETRNGGLNVTLSGDRWDGEGLDVETSNGGVTLNLPDNYNAELETRTVNGGLRIDFPITVQGELTGRRGLTTTLGSGGPLVRVRTTNGGVKISRR